MLNTGQNIYPSLIKIWLLRDPQYEILPPISAHLMLPFCSWFLCLKLPRENLVVKVLMAFLVQEERE